MRRSGHPRVTFVLAKVTKTVLPRKPPTLPCASRRHRRSPNSPGAEPRASGSNTGLAIPPLPAAMLGRRLRGGEPTKVWRSRCSAPYGAPKHRPLLRIPAPAAFVHPAHHKPLAESLKGRVRETRVDRQDRDVLSGHHRDKAEDARGLSRHSGASVSLGPFLSRQERSSPSGARTRLKQGRRRRYK